MRSKCIWLPVDRCLATCLLVATACVGVIATGTTADNESDESTGAKLVARIEGFPDWVTSVAMTGDGEHIAAGSFESVRLISKSGETLADWKPGAGFVRALLFTNNSKTLIVAGYKDITLWSLPEGDDDPTQTGRLKGHRGYVEDLALPPDGQRLASCGEDGTVRLWDIENLSEVAQAAGDRTPVQSVAFFPNGDWLAVALGDETRLSQKGHVKLLDAATLKEVREMPDHERAATAVCFTSDRRFLLSAAVDERVHVVDPQSGEAHGFIGAHTRPVNCLAITGDDRVAISGSGGRFQGKNEVKFWHPEEGTVWASIEPHEGKVNDLAVSANGTTLVTASQDKTVAIIDISGILTKAQADSESGDE